MASSVVCNGKTYKCTGLVGYGLVPSVARDKFGDTLGGIGSSVVIDPSSWKKNEDGTYRGVAWCLPDRGWNREGTLNFQNRVHKIELEFTEKSDATAENPSDPNLKLRYVDTILFTGPDDTPTTGLDANGQVSYPGFPDLPAVTFRGDGFGQDGPESRRIAVDCEGLVLGSNGTFWVSEEYGPYIYQFSSEGRMLQAIRPPDAYIPRRNGTVSFSSASLSIFDRKAGVAAIDPEDPESGRGNNQGFEGLTILHDGKKLYALLQSALNQEGGKKRKTRRHARLIEYDISEAGTAVYAHEYVVRLPLYDDKKAAGQSDILYVGNKQFLILARDSNAGHGSENLESESLYRQVDIFDISEATDIKSDEYDHATGAIASQDGKLVSGIVPAEYCEFVNINDNSELAKFKLHNGGAQDAGLLNEKWESVSLVPVEPKADGSQSSNDGKEYFMICFSDNDFITQDGRMNFGKYHYQDASGFEVDSQVLIFRVTLP
ncbi:hypothetical protein H2201_005042 [Coniosporium apollinis]|uniref:Phytase-like domain-containing protein n=1 Tax=Coniosporium apollinis TaxID=61459 RepID=A0ABQ9NUW2_9PEZI|nr:hypothetical protein H2201_005042 [Coniosporium apollinis]